MKTRASAGCFSAPDSLLNTWDYVPKNTEKATLWALRMFNEWRGHRNKSEKEPAVQCPKLEPNAESLNYWLVIECCRDDGKPQPSLWGYSAIVKDLFALQVAARSYQGDSDVYDTLWRI